MDLLADSGDKLVELLQKKQSMEKNAMEEVVDYHKHEKKWLSQGFIHLWGKQNNCKIIVHDIDRGVAQVINEHSSNEKHIF